MSYYDLCSCGRRCHGERCAECRRKDATPRRKLRPSLHRKAPPTTRVNGLVLLTLIDTDAEDAERERRVALLTIGDDEKVQWQALGVRA